MESSTIEREKCMSLQNIFKKREVTLTSNTSAPFDLYCLKKEQKFVFAKPVFSPPKPCLLLKSTVNEADIIEIIKIVGFECNKNSIGDFLVRKGLDYEHVTEKDFLIFLFLEIIDYAAQKDFTGCKLACLLNIYISAHYYMKSNDWRQPKDIWGYFKEVLIKHTIEDSPDGQEVLSPEESYDILSHFHTIYMNNLTLVHMLVFATHRLRLVWPFH